MSTLAATRSALAHALTWEADEDTPALTGHPYLPARISPPVALVTEADPYLTEAADRFGGWVLHHRATLVTRPGTNAVMTRDLDQLITEAINALEDAGHTVTEAGGFYTLRVGTAEYLAADLTTTTTTPNL